MPATLEDLMRRRAPTADEPLLGQTVLIVEDSRFASEALRLILRRSGARVRRADSLAAANRHLRTYRPSVTMVDLGLPDGDGLDLISRLHAGEPRVDVILAMSGDESLSDRATGAGADAFLGKPILSAAQVQNAILAQLSAGPRAASARRPEDAVAPDRLALCDDLRRAAALLDDRPGGEEIRYLATFLLGLAKTADDDDLAGTAAELRAMGRHGTAAPQRLACLAARLRQGLPEDIAV